MALWTEYEGKTIDGAFPLYQLLRPDGASAFFITAKDGHPRIIRLIETNSDQDDILSRWRGVAALDHPNILKIEDYGQVVINHTTLLYAVMEPVDINLGDVVGAQHLTLEETWQLAVSLLSVLEALHSHGFVHGHVEPSHVVAVHETVKLQCDAIHDAPEGKLGQELKQQDVHDLAVLLGLALSQERPLNGAGAQLPLPAPFDSIVSKGASGEWGLAEISAALEAAPEIPSGPLHKALAPAIDNVSVTAQALPSPQMPLFAEAPATGLPSQDLSTQESPGVVEDPPENVFQMVRWIVISLAVVLILVLAITWRFLPGGKPGGKTQPAAVSSRSSAAIHQPSSAPTPPPAAPLQASPSTPAPAAVSAQWQVIAYSFRREAQAQKKADRIARRHSALHPEVLHPGASSRYLVTVGGPMNREQAEALAKELRHQGFPRTTYAQQNAAPEP